MGGAYPAVYANHKIQININTTNYHEKTTFESHHYLVGEMKAKKSWILWKTYASSALSWEHIQDESWYIHPDPQKKHSLMRVVTLRRLTREFVKSKIPDGYIGGWLAEYHNADWDVFHCSLRRSICVWWNAIYKQSLRSKHFEKNCRLYRMICGEMYYNRYQWHERLN